MKVESETETICSSTIFSQFNSLKRETFHVLGPFQEVVGGGVVHPTIPPLNPPVIEYFCGQEYVSISACTYVLLFIMIYFLLEHAVFLVIKAADSRVLPQYLPDQPTFSQFFTDKI